MIKFTLEIDIPEHLTTEERLDCALGYEEVRGKLAANIHKWVLDFLTVDIPDKWVLDFPTIDIPHAAVKIRLREQWLRQQGCTGGQGQEEVYLYTIHRHPDIDIGTDIGRAQ